MRRTKSAWIAWTSASGKERSAAARRIRTASGLGRPMTLLTVAGSASTPAAPRAARDDALTASPSWPVVPAMSKTTSSIMALSQKGAHGLLREAERQGHPGAPYSGDGKDLRRGARDDVGGRRMFDIDPVPARGDGQVGDVHERAQV